MSYAVLKAAGYVLVHTPDMIMHNGTTQTVEKAMNPDSEYLKKVPEHLRTFEEVVNYAPNQTYIGNLTPEALGKLEKPWVGVDVPGSSRDGKFGEIMPQVEFIAMLKLSDVFDLVKLEKSFMDLAKAEYGKNALATPEELARLGEGDSLAMIEELVNVHHAEAIYHDGKLVGCVKKAHDVDVNLNAHVMFENLVVKASGILAFKHLVAKNNIDPLSIDYVIECSEEACGDMNQRGGGNFAKSIAEMGGAVNATGSDLRGFCAAPTHALITAASLVKADTYKNVVIVAGGATAKLGMNGKDHVKKGLPILEDVLGGFALLISENDGSSPVLRTDLVGKHNVGTGSSPQAVITALISMPLDKGNLKVTDIDKYSVEMQNPDITKPAGAGDVPEANYKMIAAIGVKRGELERTQLNEFVEKHGMNGWAPTQGHIPSGVPYAGFAIDDLTTGSLNRAMIVGKGSLFLGRMTNLFDGVSIVVERNSGETASEGASVSKEEINNMIAEAMRGFAAHLLNA
ncbi:MAG: glycine reductase [Acidaminobacter sp.]|uniref:glycine/sarcosine/betaine reductase complex component C subunit beta n=1 Tax=Acidaminobacter sp. TaxID=1872102 RepID=UPI0013846C2E|nr:glycine/sarcosine/betaine reductase complex component C subunit beta [Acidaminobacter sp.]MZQ97641.1 glycine reductase [Acidaminobacter sp.]